MVRARTKGRKPVATAPAKTTNGRRRAFSYWRFSTPEQAAGDSRRRQTEAAERYAANHDLDLDTKLTFADLGVSAFDGSNLAGALGAFLEAVKEGLIPGGSYLLVENIDRVSRQGFWAALPTLQAIINAGITLVTLTDERKYDLPTVSSDPMAIMALCFGLIRAGEESSLKARRVGEAWAAKRKKLGTTPLTARVPGWCVLDKAAGKIKLIEERAKVIRYIFRETLKGVGQNSLVVELNRQRIPCFGRAKYWHRSYLAKILTSPTTMGTFTPHTKRKADGGKRKPLDPIQGYYPAVIDRTTFVRVQALLKTKSPRRGRHAHAEVRNIFAGIATCPRCGSVATRVYKGEKPKGGAYLACSSAKAGVCKPYTATRYERLEEAFLRDADAVLNAIPAGDPSLDAAVENADAAVLHLAEERENLLDAIQRGGGNGGGAVDALVERLKGLDEEMAAFRQEQDDLLSRQADSAGAILERKARDLHGALRKKPLERGVVNSLLRQLFERVVIEHMGASKYLRLVWRHAPEAETLVSYGTEKES